MSEPATSPPASWAGWARVQVHPGTGVVDRRGDTLLVVPSASTSQHDQVKELLDLCRRHEPSGEARLRVATALVESSGPGEVPGFALLVRSGVRLRTLVAGGVRLVVDGRVAAGLVPEAPTGAVEQVLEDGGWRRIFASSADASPPDVSDALPLDLETGTVPGAAVTLLRLPAQAARAQLPAAGVATPPPSRPAQNAMTTMRPAVQFRSVLLGECAAVLDDGQRRRGRRRAPLPAAGDSGYDSDAATRGALVEALVDGVLCSRGHFNDPDLPTCPSCGAPIPADQAAVLMPRPPLGILVTDGGTIYTVTGNYVIGREAQRSPDVLSGRARALPLRDAARSTSRIHARLTVSGWKVMVTDARSANGTFLSRNGASGPWRRLAPEVPVALAHGDRMRLGKRQLLFDSWREPALPRVLR